MRYSVTCNECGRSFVAESSSYGRKRFRCPYCGNVVTCDLRPAPLPVVEARPVSRVQTQNLPKGKVKVVGKKRLSAMEQAQSVPSVGKQQSKGVIHKLVGTGKKTCSYAVASYRWTSDKVVMFHQKYDDADLWLFFGFSILFILAVIGGLYLFAWFAKLIVTGHSWLFKLYLDLVHTF